MPIDVDKIKADTAKARKDLDDVCPKELFEGGIRGVPMREKRIMCRAADIELLTNHLDTLLAYARRLESELVETMSAEPMRYKFPCYDDSGDVCECLLETKERHECTHLASEGTWENCTSGKLSSYHVNMRKPEGGG